MSSLRTRQALDSTWLLLFASRGRKLHPPELDELERQCAILSERLGKHYLGAHALLEFAAKVRESGVMASGQPDDVQTLLDDVESLKLLVG